jgi:hypothetical protein
LYLGGASIARLRAWVASWPGQLAAVTAECARVHATLEVTPPA